MPTRDTREPTNRLADRLPWLSLIAPGLICQKHGFFQKTVGFRGPDLGSSSPHELLYAGHQLNNALMRLGSGWATFFESRRLRCSAYPQSRWEHPAAWIADVERARSFSSGVHYESEYFLTFVWLPPSAAPPSPWEAITKSFFYDDAGGSAAGDPRRERAAMKRDIERFCRSVDAIVRLLRSIFPRVWELDDGETLTYLHGSVSTNRQSVAVPEVPMYLDHLLADVTFSPGDNPRLGDHFLRTCTITDFPPSLHPGVLDRLNHLQCEYRFMTRWIALDKVDANRLLDNYQAKWLRLKKGFRAHATEYMSKQPTRRVNLGAEDNASNVEDAMRSLSADVEGFGYYTATVTVWDKSRVAVGEKAAAVRDAINAASLTAHDETSNSRQAWFGSLPGNVYANVRRPILSTRNLARLLPTTAPWSGRPVNEHLLKICGVGEPHVLCMTSGATPFRLNLNVGDVGHSLILGPTGAGKSTLLNILALQWPKYPGARVIIFDKDRSARASTLAMGGVILEPGSDAAPVSFQPLRDIDSAAARIWASEFVLSLFEAQGVATPPELKEAVDRSLERLQRGPAGNRTLTDLSRALQSFDPSYAQALRPYCGSGAYAQIFDANEDHIAVADWLMIEMGHLMAMGPAVVVPALVYLFHRIERLFTGGPTLLILDEAWVFLSHPVFALRIKEWLKTLRKKNVFVIFATQAVADALSNPILHSTLLSECKTQIFLANDKAKAPAVAEGYIKGMGLTETEVSELANMTMKRDYYFRSTEGRRVFSLELGPVQLAFAGMSGAEDQKAIDRIVETRPQHEIVEALIEHAKVDWAVAALRRQATGGGHHDVTPASRGRRATAA
jgi:type IV secretion/conjugal transfer VirB4 family ATPase